MKRSFKGVARLLRVRLIQANINGSLRVVQGVKDFDVMKKHGLVTFKVRPADAVLLHNFIAGFERQKADPEIELSFKIKGKPRTLKMNRLYWSLVAVLAQEVYQMNGWEEVIHEELLQMYSPLIESKLHGTKIPKRSKEMDTAEFCKLIEGTIHEINEIGVSISDPGDINQYWNDYQKLRFQDGKDLSDRTGESLQQYRIRVNYCEACRKYLRPGSGSYDGHLAHIISRGAGGPDETWNILHLCHKHHIEDQHQHGWENLLKGFPHLIEKYEIAQKRFYEKNNI